MDEREKALLRVLETRGIKVEVGTKLYDLYGDSLCGAFSPSMGIHINSKCDDTPQAEVLWHEATHAAQFLGANLTVAGEIPAKVKRLYPPEEWEVERQAHIAETNVEVQNQVYKYLVEYQYTPPAPPTPHPAEYVVAGFMLAALIGGIAIFLGRR